MSLLREHRLLPAVLAALLCIPLGCDSMVRVSGPSDDALPEASGAPDRDEAADPDLDPTIPPKPDPEEPADPLQPSDDALVDFSVVDANEASTRFGETVSPRDYLGQVSAWYFGHST